MTTSSQIDKRKQLFFDLAVAPVVFAATMFVGAVAGLPVEDLWVYPALFAAAYPVAIYFDVPRLALWIAAPLLALSSVLSVLKYGGGTLTPIGALMCIAVVAAAFFILGRLREILSAKLPFASAILVAVGYAMVGLSMLKLNDPYYDYYIKPLKWKVSIAIEQGYDERLRSSAKKLSLQEDLTWELCHAALDNNVNAAKILVELEADPLAKNEVGSKGTALDCALQSGSSKVLDYLLGISKQSYADLNGSSLLGRHTRRSWQLESEDEDRAAILRKILSAHATDTDTGERYATALLRDASECYGCGAQTIQLLLGAGADPNAEARKVRGNEESILEYVIRTKGAESLIAQLLTDDTTEISD